MAVMVSGDYLAYVLDQLDLLGRVVTRRMFGGVGLYRDGTFFALIDDDVVYFKVDDRTRADYEARRCRPFQYSKAGTGQVISMSYYQVPAEVLEDAETLALWARKALASAMAARAKKPGKPRK